MNANEDHIYISAKMSRFDNDGRKITNDILGTGGARRDNGTISSAPFDLRIVDNEEQSSNSATGESNFLSHVLTASVSLVAGYAISRITPKIENWWRGVKQPTPGKRWDEMPKKPEVSPVTDIGSAPLQQEPSPAKRRPNCSTQKVVPTVNTCRASRAALDGK